MSKNSRVFSSRRFRIALCLEQFERRHLLASDPGFWMGFEGSNEDLVGPNDGASQGAIEYVAGISGNAVRFDGSQSINILKQSGAFDFGAGDFSVEAWVKPELVQSGGASTLFLNYGGVSLYALAISAEGHLQFECRDSAGNYVIAIDDGPDGISLLDDNWHHIATTREGSNFSIYVDGTLRTNVVQALGVITPGNSFIRVSGANTGPGHLTSPVTNQPQNNFHGLMDELFVYPRALTATEIARSLAQATVEFGSALTIPDTGTSFAVGTGDFNEDGLVDLASANYGTGSINISLGLGDGMFGSVTAIAVGGEPSSVAVGDIDGDGHLDIATGTYSGKTIVVLFGNGDGTFGDLRAWSNNFAPVEVKIADVSGDGMVDVISANLWNPGGTVTVLKSGANRTFDAPVDFVAGSGAQSLVVVDLDGDGDLDVATANYFAGTMSTLMNDGTGQLIGLSSYASGELPVWIDQGDFDGDSHIDLVVSNRNGANLSVYRANGNGTFHDAVHYSVGAIVETVRVSDFNQDGMLDLAVSMTDTDEVGVLLGFGDGTFGRRRSFPTGDAPYGLAVADLDNNGTPDIATANYLGDSLSVLRNLSEPLDLEIHGTSADDTIRIWPSTNPGQFFMRLNTEVAVLIAPERNVVVNGFSGLDRFILEGSSGVNQFDLHEDTINFNGVNFRSIAIETRQINALGNGDTIRVYGGSAIVKGGNGSDTLIAMASLDHDWIIDGTNSGSLDGRVSFTSIESLVGGLGSDSFEFAAEGSLSGGVDGVEGSDTIDYSNLQSAIRVNLQSERATKTGGIRNIKNFVGSAAYDTLILADDTNRTVIDGVSSGVMNSEATFRGFENLVGGDLSDEFIFDVLGSLLGDLEGGGGSDTLSYRTGSELLIDLEARTVPQIGGQFQSIESLSLGSGVDTIVGRNLPSNWIINDPSTVTVAGMKISGLDKIVGGADSDVLIGKDQVNTWRFTAANSGTVAEISWQGIENVNGGLGDDTFKFLPGSSLTGKLIGGSGADTLDFSSIEESQFVDLASATTSIIGEFASISAIVGSGQHDAILGRDNSNMWRVTEFGGQVEGIVFSSFEFWVGGSALDTIVAANAANTWRIVGENAGVVGDIQFSGMENLTGGGSSDYFEFQATGKITGAVEGSSGFDIVDLSSSRDGVVINLASSSASTIGTFGSIEFFRGSEHVDTLVGPDAANNWRIEGTNSGFVRSVEFANFDLLQGGTNADRFQFKDGATFDGRIDGGPGTDLLDYSNVSLAVMVNLYAGLASGVASIADFENVTGGPENDVIVGDSEDNVLIGGMGDDILLGMSGNDTINGNAGRDVVFGGRGSDFLHGNSGEDLIVGGSCTYCDDALNGIDFVALEAILSEWRRSDATYQQRISRLKGLSAGGLNGDSVLNSSTIIDDLDEDVLWGEAGLDWFWIGSGDLANSTSNEELSS